MKRFILPTLMVCLSGLLAVGQSTTYRIQVGTFVDAKKEDFSNLKPLGFVYAEEQANNYYTVYLGGGIPNAQEAGQLSQQVRSQGYYNARPEPESPSGNRVYTIQFASLGTDATFDWEKYFELGQLYFTVQPQAVKLLVGSYPDPNTARAAVDQIRSSGFSGAFLKQIDQAYMHKVGAFELAGIKRPLIPLSINQNQTPTSYNSPPPNTGTGMQARGKTGALQPTETATPPEIRGDIRRNSAYELQKVLKAQGYYDGSLDGYYGQGTAAAYQEFIQQNRGMQQYVILARNLDFSIQTGPNDPVQQAINNLKANPWQSVSVLQNSPAPVAFAYRAYQQLVSQGPGNQVNSLMQEALKRAFSNLAVGQRLPINIDAPYAYMDLTQLLNHLQYVHAATADNYVVPCWLYSEHPREIAAARVGFFDYANDSYALESCDQFTQWEEIRIMITVAEDLGGRQATDDSAIMVRNASRRTKLYFLSGPLQNPEIGKQATEWYSNLMAGLDKWAGQDPLHQKLLLSFKVSFYQSVVRLEDFFLDKGYSEREARTLALATLHTLVSFQLERFV